jgi:hypothetical protein
MDAALNRHDFFFYKNICSYAINNYIKQTVWSFSREWGAVLYRMLNKDDVERLVREKGPLIPNDLKKELQADTIIIGAVLSQLVSEGKARVTKVKIGGSPAYYAPGTEEKLIQMMKHLNEKDRRTAELLQEHKILQESGQDPLVRVCLRNIKDFAKPLEVTVNGQAEIFWKWFLTSAEDAHALIAKELNIGKKPEALPEAKIMQEEKKPDETLQQVVLLTPEKKTEEEGRKQKARVRAKASEFQKPLIEEAQGADRVDDAFFAKAREHFRKNNIVMTGFKIVRKSEIDFFITVPTGLGSQDYYCKARDKKKVNDGDLSTAYIQGQATKLPIVFLTTGELTKKAKEMLSSLKGIIIANIK